MKILKAVAVAVALFLAPVDAFSRELGLMHISLLEGDVQIKMAETDDWGAAALNGPVREGDQLWIPQSSMVELLLNSGSYIRLDADSALQILSLDKDSSQFHLSQGHIYIYNNPPPGGVLQVDTPDASTRVFHKAVFRIDMSDHFTDVAVYEGFVETENLEGRTRVNTGQMVSLAQDTDGEVAPMGSPDAWERWNKERNDRVFAREYESSRYLPPELRPYAHDFDTGGRWVQVPDYGYAWTPTVTIGASWAPYRRGRWSWIGGDYVWISADPWGWAPYHYGRWVFIARTGWCWVPPMAGDVYWGPGFVGWVGTDDYVAWVPLAPGEIYYGRGFYGRHSVNITTINVTQVRVTNVYRNVQVNNAVVVVNRRTFATGSPRIVRLNREVIRQKVFVRDHISIGSPAIKPSRSGHFMSTRRIPTVKRPPAPVREVQVTRLREARPLVREPDRSVLNRGAIPRALPMNTVTTPGTPGKGKPSLRSLRPEGRERPRLPEAVPQPGERPRVAPPERRSGAPEGGPGPSRERPQVQPPERKSDRPEVSRPKGPRPQVEQEGRRPVEPEGPPQKGVKPQVQPPERERRTVVPETPAPGRERPATQPPERKPVVPEASSPGRERPQVSPRQGVIPVPQLPAPGVERPLVKPPERKPAVPEVPSGREERPQVAPREREGKPLVPAVPQPGVSRPRVAPQEQSPAASEGRSPRGERERGGDDDDSPRRGKSPREEQQRR